jgi:hypothetical protein
MLLREKMVVTKWNAIPALSYGVKDGTVHI